MQIVKSLRSGQITIPASFRTRLGIDSQTLLQITLVKEELRIKPLIMTFKASDSLWFKKLYDQFGQIRKEASQISGKEIDNTIDTAIQTVRKLNAKNCH